jgi:two-component system sensor histidine kinase VicK
MQWSAEDKSLFCVLHDISLRKQAERLKQEVLAMVSHDLRAPLTSLSVMFDLFEIGRLGELNDNGQKKVVQSRQIIARLMSLINDLLDMEKLESGALELDYTEIAAPDLVSQALDLVRNSAERRKIQITIPTAAISITCDADRIARVITNLLDNAIKFSPEGGQIAISAEQLDNEVELTVADHGKGVPADKRDLIFERFKQSDSSGEIEKKGSGLGLTICKAIVGAHGGTIGVRAGVESGSVFWFRLPAKSQPELCSRAAVRTEQQQQRD